MSVTDVLQSIGMDVPDRERLGWLGDVSQYSEAAMRMLDTTAFFENQLRESPTIPLNLPAVGFRSASQYWLLAWLDVQAMKWTKRRYLVAG